MRKLPHGPSPTKSANAVTTLYFLNIIKSNDVTARKKKTLAILILNELVSVFLLDKRELQSKNDVETWLTG